MKEKWKDALLTALGVLLCLATMALVAWRENQLWWI